MYHKKLHAKKFLFLSYVRAEATTTRSALNCNAGDTFEQAMSNRFLFSRALCLFCSVMHVQTFKYSRENKKC